MDERFYALRYGMGSWVTAPSMEIAGDLEELRLGIHQRWQTKRGPPDNYHIIDWITLDTDVILYPDPNRDNFGQVAGLLDYNFRWHVGDRLTLVSDGNFDFFDYGEKEVTIGAFLNRPPRGTWYFGARFLEGPISEDVVTIAYNYLMSPKWMSSYSMTLRHQRQQQHCRESPHHADRRIDAPDAPGSPTIRCTTPGRATSPSSRDSCPRANWESSAAPASRPPAPPVWNRRRAFGFQP